MLHFGSELSLCARGVGNSAIPFPNPAGVIHAREEAGEGTVVPHDTKCLGTFPAVGKVPHPQIRRTDTSECSGCRKTGGETSTDANL